ncbi:hypothetical protein [Salinibacter ruber]|uniref:Uncharacterized protein n=2 Tax=Salinibacter ruber TaxID=146919 RepID=A0A9X2Z4H5_9BACT|nr:hypothetical protein [Salinibacter ruber]MCS3658332.1 hypothetical protein [Salinibacter ruber]MCS3951828.1 hypothetical protein [Salinibacter ruber]MCS4118160.1 hypothetical protein [Salinibacter ruber]MCS4154476.1 hypothetical protein [Salinibacter ruber]MCS4171874.1 hypothetical protein [Salinibacter ruber]
MPSSYVLKPVSAECQRYACAEKVSFFEIERTNPMYEQLFSRFTEAFKSSLEDPDIHLSYTDRQRLKAGEYADVAAEKLPTLERRIYWTKAYAAVATVLLISGGVLTGLSYVGVGVNWTLEEFALPLYLAFCMGFVALAGMWRMVKLEKQRLLCELVVAQSEEETAEKKEKAAASPPM